MSKAAAHRSTDLPPGSQSISYEQRLSQNSEWAMSEGSLFFQDKGSVQESLQRITARLNELGIPYAVVGGMALFKHGFRRFTEDVDLLVTREGLHKIHEHLDGLGYLRPYSRSKNLRDTRTGVRIEFLIAGDFPGDGKPKPVSFPDPATVAVELDGICYIGLPTLVELKLASGMSNIDRNKDLVDVQELIKQFALPLDFHDQLNAYVREKYDELWRVVRSVRRRYVRRWQNDSTTAESEWNAMLADGALIDRQANTAEGCIELYTFDPEIARKYGMEDTGEILNDEDNESAAP